jgi:hypothetical protein
MAYLNSELLNEMGAMDMTFSKVTQDIMARLQRWRAAGDPYADRKLAENIDAAIGKRPLPSYSEENPATRRWTRRKKTRWYSAMWIDNQPRRDIP